jgi:hypothetical protein
MLFNISCFSPTSFFLHNPRSAPSPLGAGSGAPRSLTMHEPFGDGTSRISSLAAHCVRTGGAKTQNVTGMDVQSWVQTSTTMSSSAIASFGHRSLSLSLWRCWNGNSNLCKVKDGLRDYYRQIFILICPAVLRTWGRRRSSVSKRSIHILDVFSYKNRRRSTQRLKYNNKL